MSVSPDQPLLTGPVETEPAGSRTLHILVVDDDDVDRLAVRRSLNRAGLDAEVTDAADGATAQRAASATAFDCILLDYNIPGSEGIALLRALRQAAPASPVIMLTGQGDEQVAVELMKNGAVDYLPKTALSADRLASSVRRAVELMRASLLARQAGEELRESALRARFLAEASAVLTRSLDPRENIDEVARLALPFLADYCIIYRVDVDGEPEPVAAAHQDQALRETMAVIGTAHRPGRDHPVSPVAESIRTGEQVLVSAVTEEFLHDIAGSPDVLAALHRLAPSSVLVLPLAARQRIRGALALGRCGGRSTFSAADIELARDFAQRTALAFDNAGLYEAAQQARQRTERLQQVTASLARVLPRDEVGELFVRQVRDALGADTAWVALRSNGDELVGLAHDGFSSAEIAPFLRFPADLPAPSRDVLADGGDRWYRSGAELLAAYPELEAAMTGVDQEALGVLPLNSGDGPFGVMTVGFRQARDVHEDDRSLARAMAAQCAQALERARLYDAEREARERAETANRAKSEFLARMSHDLRTPLNAIGGYAELVEMGLRGPVTEQQQEDMVRIRRAKDHLLTLINDILSFAKLEAGQVAITIDDVDVAEVANELYPLIEPQAASRGLRLEKEGTSLRVRADRERLIQVLVNLATNAVKFTDQGTVAVSWEQRDGSALIRVTDTGRGIAPDRLPTIFDPFVQVGDAAAQDREGVGLGLAISRELLRLMDGELEASSRLNEGSEFTVRLPLA
ncbi:MAG TPA: ATP-binding protein [Longimicrobiales bacterium]|nr:ATP-binding protein [Longimicrobiales bacterium]